MKRRAYAVVSPSGVIEVQHIRWKKSEAILSYTASVNMKGGFIPSGGLNWANLRKMGWQCLPVNLTI